MDVTIVAVGFVLTWIALGLVSRAYGIFATPVAFLLDERTVVAADVAVGRDAILALAARGTGS